MPDFTVLTSYAGISENYSVLLKTRTDGEKRELTMEKLDCLRDTYGARVSMSRQAAEYCRIGVRDPHGETYDSPTPRPVLLWCSKRGPADTHKHLVFVHQGKDVSVCGNIAPLGNWNPNKTKCQQRSLPNGLGVTAVCVSSDVTDFEYKLIKKDRSGNVTWEEPAFVNRRVSLEIAGDVIITGDWGDNSSKVFSACTEIKTRMFDAPKKMTPSDVITKTVSDVITKNVSDVINNSLSDVISSTPSDVINKTLSDVISSSLGDVINSNLSDITSKIRSQISSDVTSRAARSTESEKVSLQHEAARTQSAPVVAPSGDRNPSTSEAFRNYADLATTASTPVVGNFQPGSSVSHKPSQPSKIDISELVSSRYGTWPAPKRGLLRRAYSAAASAGHSMRKQISTTRLLRKLTA